MNTDKRSFNFGAATREGLKPLIGLYGLSNSGKTYSALMLARGIAGPTGKILLGDTESGRGALYADIIPGGYERADFEPPFSSKAYCDFLDAAEAQKPDVIVIDSFSHEWEGEGGVLDSAGEAEARGAKGLGVWKQPKMEHAKLVLRLLRSHVFVIVCLRGKYKSRQIKNERGKTEIVRDENVTPIQDENFIFEMTAHAEMQTADPGTIKLTKWSVPDLATCFPKAGEKLKIAHGELIAKWASGGTVKPVGTRKLTPKAALWDWATKHEYDDPAAFETWLSREGYLGSEETLKSLTPERMTEILNKLNA